MKPPIVKVYERVIDSVVEACRHELQTTEPYELCEKGDFRCPSCGVGFCRFDEQAFELHDRHMRELSMRNRWPGHRTVV